MEEESHMCIRCKMTINGLSNYLTHRESALCTPVTADAYFSSLRLQQTHKPSNESTTISTIIIKDDSDHEHDDDNDDVRSNHSSISDDDMFRPPRNFTGGKWKPGLGPHTIGHRDYHLNDCSEDSDEEYVPSQTETKDKRIEEKSQCEVSLNDEHNRMSFSCSSDNNCDLIPLLPLKDMSFTTIIPKSKRKSKIASKESKIFTNEDTELFTDPAQCENDFESLKCKKCNFIGKSQISLLKHIIEDESHIKDIIGQCQLIKYEYNLNKQLAFACEQCSFYTNQSNNFLWHITRIEHLDKNGDNSLFYCIACHYNCDNVKSLLNHMKSKQSIHMHRSGQIIICKKPNYHQTSKKSQYYQCTYCDKTFPFKTQLKKHITKAHTAKVPFPNHIISDSREDNAKYHCEKCTFKSNSESSLLLHLVNHEVPIEVKINQINSHDHETDIQLNNNEKNPQLSGKRTLFKYKCPKCDNHYICREMKSHIYVHTNEKPFVCDYCNKKFTHLSYLRAHKKRHNAIKDKICEYCGASFVFQKSLNKHLQIHDNDRKRKFKCDVCGSGHFTKSLLLEHVKRHIPKDERKYKCSFEKCRYSFVSKNELTEHQKVHSDPNDKPFLCDQCPYKSKSNSSFRKHYRQHTGSKPFKCEQCDYTTALSSNLIRHSRVHSGQKPYKCPYCSYTCNTHENIRKHILKTKKHNGLTVYPCKHCNYGTNVFAEYRKHLSDLHVNLYTDHELDSLISQLYCKQSHEQTSSHDKDSEEIVNVIYIMSE